MLPSPLASVFNIPFPSVSLTKMLARVSVLVLVVSLSVSVAGLSIGFPFGRPAVRKIMLTNDDGWATAQMRSQMDALIAEGYDVRGR